MARVHQVKLDRFTLTDLISGQDFFVVVFTSAAVKGRASVMITDNQFIFLIFISKHSPVQASKL